MARRHLPNAAATIPGTTQLQLGPIWSTASMVPTCADGPHSCSTQSSSPLGGLDSAQPYCMPDDEIVQSWLRWFPVALPAPDEFDAGANLSSSSVHAWRRRYCRQGRSTDGPPGGCG